MVVVIDKGETVEAEEARERGGLGRDTFHQIAIAANAVNPVVDNIVARPVEVGGQIFRCDCHSDRVADTLTQRARGGLNPRRESPLRMARSPAAPLAKMFDVLEREIITGEVQKTVQQHTAVTCRKDEPIAVGPQRLLLIVPKKASPKHVRHWRRAHRQTGMTGVRILHRIHRQRANGVDAKLVKMGLIERLRLSSLSFSCAIGRHEGDPPVETRCVT